MTCKILIILLLLITNLLSCTTQPVQSTSEQSAKISQVKTNSSCLINRGAIEIGSGVTKAQLSLVDICLQKVISTYWAKDFKIDFKDSLSQNFKLKGEKIFSPEVLQLAHQSIAEIIAKAKHYEISPNEIRAVATAAFREATNANIFIEHILRTQNLKISIISQIEEAKLGYYSMLALKKSNQPLVVWDIGGGSMQITTEKKQSFIIYSGQLASVSFKNLLIETIQKKTNLTPNPISADEARKGLEISKQHAENNVQPEIKKTLTHSVAYGIGGVLAISLPSQILNQNIMSKSTSNATHHSAEKTITLKDIEKKIQLKINKTDQELNSKYAATEVSNLILVAGYMQALGISQYIVGNVNNTSGILLDAAYWN